MIENKIFHHVNLIFLKNTKSLKHLKVALRIFCVSGIFQNFDVDFWPSLKAEKSTSPEAILARKKNSSKFYFMSSI